MNGDYRVELPTLPNFKLEYSILSKVKDDLELEVYLTAIRQSILRAAFANLDVDLIQDVLELIDAKYNF